MRRDEKNLLFLSVALLPHADVSERSPSTYRLHGTTGAEAVDLGGAVGLSAAALAAAAFASASVLAFASALAFSTAKRPSTSDASVGWILL